MKYASIFFCIFVCFCFLLVESVVVSAASLEDSTVPSEALDMFEVSGGAFPDSSQMLGTVDASGDAAVSYALDDSGLDGLASFTINSSIGEITLYLSDGVSSSAVRLTDGRIYNVTNSTIYLYCPDLPGYTFSASRFSPVFYRDSAGSYNSTELTGVSLVSRSFVIDDFAPYIIIFGIVFICFALMWRRVHD